MQLLTLTGSQWRSNMSGPYALDWTVCLKVATVLGIEINLLFLEKLRAYESAALKEIHKKQGPKEK